MAVGESSLHASVRNKSVYDAKRQNPNETTTDGGESSVELRHRRSTSPDSSFVLRRGDSSDSVQSGRRASERDMSLSQMGGSTYANKLAREEDKLKGGPIDEVQALKGIFYTFFNTSQKS